MDRQPAQKFQDLGYLGESERFSDAEEVARLLGAYSRTLLSPVS
jgi:hypothetical protein